MFLCLLLTAVMIARLLYLLGYGQDDRGSVPGRGKNFSLRHRVQTSPGSHPAFYSIGTGGLFPWG